MNILIVDDDPLIRQMLNEQLTEFSHDVCEARDGEEALKILHQESIGIVITDWKMPRMDGLSLIQEIRQAELPTYTYIILLTAMSDRADLLTGLQAGADDYLMKPFDLEELQARVGIGERILALERRLQVALEKLEVLALYDSLTGLYNRAAINEHAQLEVARAERTERPLSLAMLDVDYFKQVNDEYGHLVGDEVLKRVAEELRTGVRPYDFVGRWGGEEFMIVLPEATLEQATEVAERVRATIASASFKGPNCPDLQVNVSLGVSQLTIHPDRDCLRHLIQQADIALYRAKQQGRNRVCAAS